MRELKIRKQKGDPLGPGHSGSSSRVSEAEERVLAQGLEGKIDVSTRKKYITALEAEHKRTGEPKSSHTGRTKKKPRVSSSDRTPIKVLDTSKGVRVKGKTKLTPEQKAKAKRAKHNATAGKSRAEKRKYRQR